MITLTKKLPSGLLWPGEVTAGMTGIYMYQHMSVVIVEINLFNIRQEIVGSKCIANIAVWNRIYGTFANV